MRALRALLLGLLAGAVLGYAAAATAAVVLSVAGVELTLAAGPVVALAVERTETGAETTFGPGLVLLAVACGVVNAAAAAVLARRDGDPMA
jgi:hypothetical protein